DSRPSMGRHWRSAFTGRVVGGCRRIGHPRTGLRKSEPSGSPAPAKPKLTLIPHVAYRFDASCIRGLWPAHSNATDKNGSMVFVSSTDYATAMTSSWLQRK